MAAAILIGAARRNGRGGEPVDPRRDQPAKVRGQARAGQPGDRTLLYRGQRGRAAQGTAAQALCAKLLDSALEFYKKLQASLDAESGEAPRPELAAAYEKVGEITRNIGSPTAALDALKRAHAIRKRLADETPLSDPAREALAAVLDQKGDLLSDVGQTSEALTALQEAPDDSPAPLGRPF